ncbi:TPA: hypothetical protein L4R52_002082 [Pseudomonas aeruginosa]|nr:hypothetical protein [Pseudomonas aeruginosa]
MAYYKTNSPKVLQGWADYVAQADALQAEADAFAARYPGAKPLISTSVLSGRRFYGLAFDPPMPDTLWTKPNYKAGREQSPRRAPAGVKGEERKRLAEELKVIRDDYNAHKPKIDAPLDPFLETLGLSGGALFFSRYKQFFGADGFIYIETNAQPSGELTEILGSEFAAAEKASDQAAA